MYTALRKSLNRENDKGFTLIELLVVIVIIGILAAVAIPIFLNQRKKAADASVKSDVRSVATALETAFTDNAAYPAAGTGATELGTLPVAGGTLSVAGEQVRLSPNNTVAEVRYNAAAASATAFCVRIVSSKGSNATGFVWRSDAGGLQPASVTACDTAVYTQAIR
ncbi:type II secretion system protein [Sporichthya polymorpha]|uniref:type II secretion system protein n=1 Tax=Sporichthya polymorpha TaxID=35751 RepID=UPI00036B79CF|nr:prepilin-type N-terminal cleavage/methylation domain-containing protein [Sporichthya polymorpha]